MNVAMVGHGMMGVWHTEALAGTGAVKHTLVGRRPEPTAAFAAEHGYARWTIDLDEALADPAVDAVIVGSPSEQHADHALRCLAAGKHVLLEIPVAMSLARAEQVAAAASGSGKVVAMCHPMRFRRERDALRARIAAGEERIRHLAGRFFIPRLVNIGATGYRRSWTDNILWHHFCHFVDLACWLFAVEDWAQLDSFYPDVHPTTGIPMECVILAATGDERSFMVHGSYHATYRFYDKLIVTDRDTYVFDILAGTLRTRDGVQPIEDEKSNCFRVTRDFIDAVETGRPPRAPVASVLPAMRVLQRVQDVWDLRHGPRDLPGRPLSA